MTYKINVKAHNQYGLTENGQTSKSNFAVIGKDGDNWQTLCPLVRCRDYFNDMMFVQHSDERQLSPIYGWEWEFSQELDDMIHKEAFVPMLLNYTQKQGLSWRNWNALHTLEEFLGFNATNVVDVETLVVDEDQYKQAEWLVLEADPRWYSSSVMLSLYTMCIRLLDTVGDTYEEIVKKDLGTDSNFSGLFEGETGEDIKLLLANWETIIGKNIAQGCVGEDDGEGDAPNVDRVHNGSGIKSMMYGLTSNSPEPSIKQWADNFKMLKQSLCLPEPTKVEVSADDFALSA